MKQSKIADSKHLLNAWQLTGKLASRTLGDCLKSIKTSSSYFLHQEKSLSSYCSSRFAQYQ
jgi:hypothetical protein